MAYVHRRVQAGRTVEHRKMQSYRVHTKGVQRGPNRGPPPRSRPGSMSGLQKNTCSLGPERKFRDTSDIHAVLHYYAKDVTFEEVLEDKALFLSRLRKACRKRGIKYKAVVVIETKRMTNPHIHVVISRMDPDILSDAWNPSPGVAAGSASSPWTVEATMRSWHLISQKRVVPRWRSTVRLESAESATARPRTWTSR